MNNQNKKINKLFLVVGVAVLSLCFPNADVLANEVKDMEVSPQVIMERALENIPNDVPHAGSYNPETDSFTISQGNKDGSRTVTELDRNGKEVKKTKVPKTQNDFAESYDPKTGRRIRVEGNPDGTRTVTETDKDGKKIREEKIDPKDNRPSASSTDPSTGITTSVQGNGDGTRTITQTDASGNVISSQTL